MGSASQNNGKITSQTDNISGEQVVYGHDGFGNLQSQAVTAGTPADRILTKQQQQLDVTYTFVAQGVLKNWQTTNLQCPKDLGVFGLNPSDINDLDSNTKLISYASAVSPQGGLSGSVDPNGDFTAIPRNTFNVIVYRSANFWQYTFSEVLGMLLHEDVHLGAPDLTDEQIQAALGLTANSGDHSNISTTLANDCFWGAAVPWQP